MRYFANEGQLHLPLVLSQALVEQQITLGGVKEWLWATTPPKVTEYVKLTEL